jgi:hypothetical protein
MKRKLYELAHARAGDKGDTTILSLIAYHVEDFALLQSQVTAQAVRQHFAGVIKGDVTRHELPHLGALQFVGTHALGGGVTTSLGVDAHGKSLSSALLEMEIEN